ncbi:MAG: sulfatase-like hydrolase/transferase [Planctomycetota bacterium]
MQRSQAFLWILCLCLLGAACGKGASKDGASGAQSISQKDPSLMRITASDIRMVQGQSEAFESSWVTSWYGKPAWSVDAPDLLGDTRASILCNTPAQFRIHLPASSQARRLTTAVRRAQVEKSGAIRCAVFWQSDAGLRELQAVVLPNGEDAWMEFRCDLPEEAGELIFTQLLEAPGLAEKPAGHVSWQEPMLQPISSTMEGQPDVLLLSIDTLRADALEHMPYLQCLMAEGTSWSQAYAPSNWTLPSMASLFTGLSPAGHGCGRGPFAAEASGKAETRDFRGLGNAPTLAEAFLAHGYATAMFHQNPFLENWTGMQRGFLRYARSADRVAAQSASSLEWWAQNQGQARFLSLHFMAPHLPNGEVEALDALHPEDFFSLDVTPDRRREFFDLAEADREAVRAAYRAAAMELDAELARLLPELKQASRDWRVVLYVDHGEEHWESGGFEHGFSFDDAVVRVPIAYLGSTNTEAKVIDTMVPAHHIGTYLLEQLEMEYGLPSSALGSATDADHTVQTAYPLYRNDSGGRRWDAKAGSWVTLPFTGKGSPGRPAEIDPWTAQRLAELGYAENQ